MAVNDPLIRPYFVGGLALRVPLNSHDTGSKLTVLKNKGSTAFDTMPWHVWRRVSYEHLGGFKKAGEWRRKSSFLQALCQVGRPFHSGYLFQGETINLVKHPSPNLLNIDVWRSQPVLVATWAVFPNGWTKAKTSTNKHYVWSVWARWFAWIMEFGIYKLLAFAWSREW